MSAPAMPAWSPPAYPYDRLEPLRAVAEGWPGGVVDCSIGTPGDPPPPAALSALADADAGGATRGYPPSVGTPPLRHAVAGWARQCFGVDLDPDAIGACVGTKELVAGLPGWLRHRRPDRDTVLYPAVSYPTYAMGAQLAGLRAVPVPLDASWRMDLSAVSDIDAARALLVWVNAPGNPAGGLDDLAAAARWGAERDVLVCSDECYAEFTWDGPARSVLGHGAGRSGLDGILAVHSLSKRSNLAGLRVGWYSGDPAVVDYLREVRKHAGLMVPGAAQRAAAAALADRGHVEVQRARYHARLERMAGLLRHLGVEVGLPGGGFYLWVPAPGGDAWALAERLAADAGLLVSPGEFYGPDGAGHVRVAMVVPDDAIDLVAQRLAARAPR